MLPNPSCVECPEARCDWLCWWATAALCLLAQRRYDLAASYCLWVWRRSERPDVAEALLALIAESARSN